MRKEKANYNFTGLITAAVFMLASNIAQAKMTKAAKVREPLVICQPVVLSAATTSGGSAPAAAASNVPSAADPSNYILRVTAGPKAAQGGASVWAANFYFAQTPTGRTGQAGHSDVTPVIGGAGSASASAPLLDLKNTVQSPSTFELQVSSLPIASNNGSQTSTQIAGTTSTAAPVRYSATLINGAVFSGSLTNIPYECEVSAKLLKALK